MTTARPMLAIPEDLPFLESISWFDTLWRELDPIDILRYEASWRFRGVLSDPSDVEQAFIRDLVERYGSHLDV